MNNAINIFQIEDKITPSFDNILFIKENNDGIIGWGKSKNSLYKGELNLPTADVGVDGDYFAKYNRLYNNVNFSENFESSNWFKNYCLLNKEPGLIFPYNSSTKLMAGTSHNEHSIDLTYLNPDTVSTFSIFVQSNEITNVAISLESVDNDMKITNTINLTDDTFNITTNGNQDNINFFSGGITQWSASIKRIWVTGDFKNSFYLKGRVQLLDNNFNKVFSTPNETYGLFINGAQLVNSKIPEYYLFTDGYVNSSIFFDSLYQKQNGEWIKNDNMVHYTSKLPSVDLGNIGDLCTITAMIEVGVAVKFGDLSSNILYVPETTIKKVWDQVSKSWVDKEFIENKLIDMASGIMYFNNETEKYYIITNQGHCEIKYENDNHKKEMLMALSLNQQTYQSYYRGTHFSHLKGYNTGGNNNFWINRI